MMSSCVSPMRFAIVSAVWFWEKNVGTIVRDHGSIGNGLFCWFGRGCQPVIPQSELLFQLRWCSPLRVQQFAAQWQQRVASRIDTIGQYCCDSKRYSIIILGWSIFCNWGRICSIGRPCGCGRRSSHACSGKTVINATVLLMMV